MCHSCVISLVLSFLCYYEAARILVVVPTPSISHQVVFNQLIKELIKRGHEVVAITTDPAFPMGQAPVNLTEINLHDVSYKVLKKEMSALKIGSGDYMYDQMDIIFKTLCKTLEVGIQTDEVKNLLRCNEDYFDLLLIETFVRPALIFTHFFKAPAISISSFGAPLETHIDSGVPVHPLLYPSVYQDKIYNLTIWEKIMQSWKHLQHANLIAKYEVTHDRLLQKIFGKDIPPLQKLAKNIDMTFLNVHSIWTDNQPMPPNVILLGGLHSAQKKKETVKKSIRQRKELSQDLKSYLNSSNHGVVYMSLGSNVKFSQLGSQRISILLKIFAELPYDFLIISDTENITRPNNVRFVKWVPQSKVLKHSKVKLFITQCGLQSTDEAIVAGVPVIGLPMFADQFYNAEKYTKHKIGFKYVVNNLKTDELKKAIKTVIEDESYRNNIIRLRSLMYDQPQTSLERAIWWTEHVLRHGGAKHLRAPAANMSWAESLELELVFILLICLLFFIAFVLFFSALALKLFFY